MCAVGELCVCVCCGGKVGAVVVATPPSMGHWSYKRLRHHCWYLHPESWNAPQLPPLPQTRQFMDIKDRVSPHLQSRVLARGALWALSMAAAEAGTPAMTAFPSVQTMERKHFDNVSNHSWLFDSVSLCGEPLGSLWSRSHEAHAMFPPVSPCSCAGMSARVNAAQQVAQTSRWLRWSSASCTLPRPRRRAERTTSWAGSWTWSSFCPTPSTPTRAAPAACPRSVGTLCPSPRRAAARCPTAATTPPLTWPRRATAAPRASRAPAPCAASWRSSSTRARVPRARRGTCGSTPSCARWIPAPCKRRLRTSMWPHPRRRLDSKLKTSPWVRPVWWLLMATSWARCLRSPSYAPRIRPHSRTTPLRCWVGCPGSARSSPCSTLFSRDTQTVTSRWAPIINTICKTSTCTRLTSRTTHTRVRHRFKDSTTCTGSRCTSTSSTTRPPCRGWCSPPPRRRHWSFTGRTRWEASSRSEAAGRGRENAPRRTAASSPAAGRPTPRAPTWRPTCGHTQVSTLTLCCDGQTNQISNCI